MQTNLNLNFCTIDSPIGKLIAIFDNNILYAMEFLDDRDVEELTCKFSSLLNKPIICSNNNMSLMITKEINEYFKGSLKHFTVNFTILTTGFQKTALETLLQIPYGNTISYKQQAYLMNRPLSFRAAANANGVNSLPIIIPCHRVIGSCKKLGGYKWGIDRKTWLIDHETRYSEYT